MDSSGTLGSPYEQLRGGQAYLGQSDEDLTRTTGVLRAIRDCYHSEDGYNRSYAPEQLRGGQGYLGQSETATTSMTGVLRGYGGVALLPERLFEAVCDTSQGDSSTNLSITSSHSKYYLRSSTSSQTEYYLK